MTRFASPVRKAALIATLVALPLALWAPAVAGDPPGEDEPLGLLPVVGDVDSRAALQNNYLFQGVATEWVWTVRGHANFEDGNHLDTGHLQIVAACLSEATCEGEFSFVGGLGTATCRVSSGEVSGHMELYAGPSFDCTQVDIAITGAGVCEAGLAADGNKMGLHRLSGIGGGLGACDLI